MEKWKIAQIFEMADRRMKNSEIWNGGGGGVPIQHIWGVLGAYLVFKVILGSLGALISKWPVTQKAERRVKFEISG